MARTGAPPPPLLEVVAVAAAVVAEPAAGGAVAAGAALSGGAAEADGLAPGDADVAGVGVDGGVGVGAACPLVGWTTMGVGSAVGVGVGVIPGASEVVVVKQGARTHTVGAATGAAALTPVPRGWVTPRSSTARAASSAGAAVHRDHRRRTTSVGLTWRGS